MRVQCSTCLELLTPGDDLTSTPCGHVFHMACVVQWFETKKNCPQCRHTANERTLRKIFLAETDGEAVADADSLQNQLESAQFQLRCKETERSRIAGRNKELEELLKNQKEEIKDLERKRLKLKDSVDSLKNQNRVLQEEKYKYEEARKAAEDLRLKLENFKSVEIAIRGQEGELNKFLHERGAFDSKTRDLATLVVMLKQKMVDVKKERTAAENKVKEASRENGIDKRKVRELEVQVADLQSIKRSLESEVWRYKEDTNALKEQLESVRKGEEVDMFDSSPLKTLPRSPSPPCRSPSPPSKLPAFKLTSAVKRSHSPEDRSPLLPLMNHSSKRLAGCTWPSSGQSTQNSMTKHYDGLGGRARSDMFPQPKKIISSQQTIKSKPKVMGIVGKQSRTIDKFFGSFDTP